MSEQEKDLKEFLKIRREKLQKLREMGINPFPPKFEYTHTPSQIHEQFGEIASEKLEAEKIQVKIAGRMISQRIMGKASFCHITDGRNRLQVYIRRDDVGEETYQLYKGCYDIGDFFGVEGWLFRTKTGELSVHAQKLTFLSKALRPLPEKWHGLHDVEVRYRQRYLDLISNPESRKVFEARSRIINSLRRYYLDHDFLEVETPMMQPIAGGANAKPFLTHHNALGMDLYLRIAPELYLKRLTVGGLERVFEINRNFRNEGVSTQHNPEFTMLESYQAYIDYHDMMDFVEELLHQCCVEVNGEAKSRFGDLEIDWSRPWRRESLIELTKQYSGASDEDLSSVENLKAFFRKRELEPPRPAVKGKMIYELFDHYVEKELQQPTFVIDFPFEVSPLSKVHRDDPELVERFELFAAGLELANGFSELNDPDDQRRRFENQLSQREGGDEEAHVMDEDYILAMEHGLPPTGGVGIGIDRLVMLLTNSPSIRDVMLFPLLKPRS